MTLKLSPAAKRIALASVLAMSTQVAWAQATISSASAHIGNLSYRLVDLDLDDGITPGIEFGPDPKDFYASQISGYFGYRPVNYAGDGYEMYANSPFQPSQWYPERNASTLLGYEFGGATATHELDRFGLQQKLATAFVTKQELITGQPQWVNPNEGVLPTAGYSEYFAPFSQFRLTANTELIIEGSLTQGIEVDPLAFVNDSELRAALTGLRGHSEITFSVNGGSWNQNPLAGQPYSNKVDLDYEIDEAGNLTTSTVHGSSASLVWSHKVTNATSLTQSGSLQFKFDATTTAVGVVPEPATWAMLFAGLGLMGVFARRRQAA